MSHRFEDHTSEVRLILEAPSLPALFAEAGHALAELMAEPGERFWGPPEAVRVQAGDPAGLLVDWLNELIFRAEVHKAVYGDIHVERATTQEVSAVVRGFEPQHLRTAVKAATLHRAYVQGEEGRYTAAVILDV